jgi:hypothetical protein
MKPRYARGLAALATAAVIALPAVAQARGGSDDPANHQVAVDHAGSSCAYPLWTTTSRSIFPVRVRTRG